MQLLAGRAPPELTIKLKSRSRHSRWVVSTEQADTAEVHVDWRMTREEWIELREAILAADGVPDGYIARLAAEGKLDA